MSQINDASIVPFSVRELEVSTQPEAVALKKRLLAMAALVTVDSAETVQEATALAGRIKGVVRQAEATHKLVKAPYLRTTQSIDQALRDFAGPLKEEIKRLEREAGDWILAEKKRQLLETMEAARKAEAVQREAEEKLAALEERRKEVEAKISAAAPDEKPALIGQIKQLAREEFQAEEQISEAVDFSLSAMTVPAVENPTGARIKDNEFDIEVVDLGEFIQFCIRSGLLARLLSVAIRVRDIKDWIALNPGVELPGLKLVPRIKIEAKATN